LDFSETPPPSEIPYQAEPVWFANTEHNWQVPNGLVREHQIPNRMVCEWPVSNGIVNKQTGPLGGIIYEHPGNIFDKLGQNGTIHSQNGIIHELEYQVPDIQKFPPLCLYQNGMIISGDNAVNNPGLKGINCTQNGIIQELEINETPSELILGLEKESNTKNDTYTILKCNPNLIQEKTMIINDTPTEISPTIGIKLEKQLLSNEQILEISNEFLSINIPWSWPKFNSGGIYYKDRPSIVFGFDDKVKFYGYANAITFNIEPFSLIPKTQQILVNLSKLFHQTPNICQVILYKDEYTDFDFHTDKPLQENTGFFCITTWISTNC